MRIALLSYWYTPEPVGKPHDLATELVRRGHDVTVITGFPNYPGGSLYPGYRRKLRQVEVLDGVKIVRLPALIDRSRSGVRRALSYASYAFLASALGGFFVNRPDVVWSYQIGLPGVALSKLCRSPLVHEVQDLWPEWSVSGGLAMGGWLYAILDGIERAIYRQARAVTTISGSFKRALVAKGTSAEKIAVLPNWANEEFFRPVDRSPGLAAQEKLGGRFNVMYGGNIGTAQALDVVLDAAELLKDLAEVQFVLVGDGVERQRLATAAAERGIRTVRFVGRRSAEQMASYLAWADVLLLPLSQKPEYAMTIPSKTYSYLAVGRPILAAAAGEVATLIRDTDAGVVCDPGSPWALAKAVRELHAMPVAARDAMGARGRQAFQDRFTRQVLVDKYEALFRQIISTGR